MSFYKDRPSWNRNNLFSLPFEVSLAQNKARVLFKIATHIFALNIMFVCVCVFVCEIYCIIVIRKQLVLFLKNVALI